MMLTPEQNALLKAAIEADQMLNALPNNTDSAFEIAAQFNAEASPAFYVWKSNANIDEIYDAITWASLTPADAPDATVEYTNRALSCQARQINLQIMLQGKQTLNATKLKIRQGLTDALQGVPSGAGGATLDAGWPPVKQALYRKATRVEALLATGTGTTGVPALMSFEGNLSYQDAYQARNS
jgi:hypothetical protein